MDTTPKYKYIVGSESREVIPDKWKKQLFLKNTADLSVSWIGHMIASPTQFYTNFYPRKDYCVQYILHGKGDYFTNNKLYHLKKGTLWLLPKEQYHYYISDKNDPYEYFWLHLDGNAVENFLEKIGLSEDNPVIYNLTDPNIERQFISLIDICKKNQAEEHLILSVLHALLYEIITAVKKLKISKPALERDHTIDDVIAFIKENYTQPIHLKDLGKIAMLNELYLIKKFKAKTGLSPVQFLNQYRISQSCSLLHSSLPLKSIASSCGFQNLTTYLRCFKQFIGTTPTQYRKSITPSTRK